MNIGKFYINPSNEEHNKNFLRDFISRIFSTEKYSDKYIKPPHIEYLNLPIFITTNSDVAKFFEKIGINYRYFENERYEDVLRVVKDCYDETNDPRVVLVGVDPIEYSGVETFTPYFDIDEDGYLEVAGSWLPADEEIIVKHIESMKRVNFDNRREKEDIVIVVQPDEYKFINQMKKQSYNFRVMEKIIEDEDYDSWKDADMIIQVSDGDPRIHSDGEDWNVSEQIFVFTKRIYQALNGNDFLRKTEDGWQFTNYPVVFSETCNAGVIDSLLRKAFTNASSLYIASTTSTRNAIKKDRWEKIPRGDGVKYGIIDKLDEIDSMFMIYKDVINTLIDNLPNVDKELVKDALSNNRQDWVDELEILSFTMYGLDRPSPVKRKEKPKKIGKISDL